MEDRISKYPGRMKMVHADGSTEYVTMSMADEATVEGTPYSKGTALSDPVAAAFGLDPNPAVPNDVLNILKDASIHRVKINTKKLSEIAEGTVVSILENGFPADFVVAKHNYEPTLNGDGRTLLVRDRGIGSVQWQSTGTPDYANSDLNRYLTTEYLNVLPEDIRAAIGETSFIYTTTEGTTATLQRPIFALSLAELGLSYEETLVEGSQLPTAERLKINSSAWVRTRGISRSIKYVYQVNASGNAVRANAFLTRSVKPAFSLPSTFELTLGAEEGFWSVLGDKIMSLPATQLAYGSYFGTGIYGQANIPNSITFPFSPKLVIVGNGSEKFFPGDGGMIWYDGITIAGPSQGTNSLIYVTRKGAKLEWYNNYSVINQLNNLATEYQYIAIG